MPEYIIGFTEFLPLSRILNPQEEARGMLKYSERTPVKFVIIEQRERVLKLLVFTLDDIFRHVDIIRKYMNTEEGETFFGAGNILSTGGAWWYSESCIRRFGRDAPEIEPAEGEIILGQVKERALECLTQVANGEVSS